MNTPDVVSRAAWLAAREALLEKEKHLTPKGRKEDGPQYNRVGWERHHRRYDDVRRTDATG